VRLTGTSSLASAHGLMPARFGAMRRPRGRTIARSGSDSSCRSPPPQTPWPAVDDFLVAREQWRAWLTDLAESPDTRWLNPLWAARSAENKLVQMRVALE
jgi:hypothetical protein